MRNYLRKVSLDQESKRYIRSKRVKKRKPNSFLSIFVFFYLSSHFLLTNKINASNNQKPQTKQVVYALAFLFSSLKTSSKLVKKHIWAKCPSHPFFFFKLSNRQKLDEQLCQYQPWTSFSKYCCQYSDIKSSSSLLL